jgi:Tfp pilus assembly protein PilF/GTPase Era involved in 16S rRNA processing
MSLWSRLERRIGDLAGELILDEYRDQLAQARALIETGDPAAARDIVTALLRAKPEHGQALILLGAAHLALREPVAARDAFERALRQRPGDPAALVGHGEALYGTGQLDDAIAALNRGIGEAAGDREVLALAYRTLGLCWRQRGDHDKAIRELRKAVAEAPADDLARAALGLTLLDDAIGTSLDVAAVPPDLEPVRRAIDKSLDVETPSALALVAAGRLALVDGAPALAAGHFARSRDAAKLDSTPHGKAALLDALIGLGDAALAARDPAAAHLQFLEALALAPRRAATHGRLAATHRAIGNFDAALTSFDRALALAGAGEGAAQLTDGGRDPRPPIAAIATLTAALDTALAARDHGRAVRYANDLLALVPDHPRALVAIAIGMIDAGQGAGARALLGPALAAPGGGDPEAHLALARLCLDSGDPAGAAAAALAALRTEPHHARARAVLADARAAQFAIPDGDGRADPRAVALALERIGVLRTDLGARAGDLARATAELDTPLLVTVMGEFSSGKSSFVNAFIGAEVAPTGITPTTATINVVRHGAERTARIVHRDGHVTAPPWEQLFDHLRVLDADATRAIDHVEIRVPLPALERIHIVDTPGLNSILPEHEATARAFIARADAVVWVFTANQGGKASERKALASIHDEGRRVLGVLNKRDQLSETECAEVVGYVKSQLAGLVEDIVPVSARRALAAKRGTSTDDGNWHALEAALETRFFAQARDIKRAACMRRLHAITDDVRRTIARDHDTAATAASGGRAAATAIDQAAARYASDADAAERRALAEATTTLYRRAAREVLELVQPRRLPFQSNSATPADRDYLIALLDAGYDAALEAGRRRIGAEVARQAASARTAAAALAVVLGAEVTSDVDRVIADRIRLVTAQVYDRARAFLRGYLSGGFVEAFFRADLARIELAEDAVFHALLRGAPDLAREVAAPLGAAVAEALAAVAGRVRHWAGVADVLAYDLETGAGRAIATLFPEPLP